MNVFKVSPEQWSAVSEKAHALCFNDHRPKEIDTHDYVMLAELSDGTPVAYATILEISKETAYMQLGGAFPESRGSMRAVKAYYNFVADLKKQYKIITTRVENINIPMLRLAMSAGFLINGIGYYDTQVFVQLELKGECQ